MNAQATSTDYAARLGLSYQPSTYQAAIFDHIENGRGHAVVEAVAGSGKTTTIVSAATLISGGGLFVAFNKSIATELGSRLAGTAMQAKTVHSVGFGAIRYANKGVNVQIAKSKYRDMVRTYEREVRDHESLFGRKLSPAELMSIDENRFPLPTVLRLLDLARLSLVDFEGSDFGDRLWDLVNHHGLEVPEGLESVVIESVRRAGLTGKSIVSEIDFTDMVWLPAVHGYTPFTFSWVFVDECQDISACALALIKRCVRRGGRMLFVGDRKQAIYGFAGADAASFAKIIESTNATVLPLSVCYRCSTSILEQAREFCPQIEAAPGAGEGTVRVIQRDDICSEVVEGDMMLCRINAPLVGTCFELIADGIAATVRGRDIGVGLCKLVDAVDCTIPTFDVFSDGVQEWLEEQVAIVHRRGGDDDVIEQRVSQLRDQAECVKIIYARSKATDAEKLKQSINDLFSDDRASVVLSSIHKAKGLEAKRIFILEPGMLRKPRGKREWMREQEKNLAYVAYTRAQQELIFVG